MSYEIKQIPLSKLALNSGQIEGLPANPRQWTREDVNRIAASLKETPELFEMRPIIAVPHGKEYVILAGSLRYCGAKENGEKTAPVIALAEDMPVRKMQEIVLKDNGSFGAWDMDALANEWDTLPLADWGVPAWSINAEDIDGIDIDVPHDAMGAGGNEYSQITFVFATPDAEIVNAYIKAHTKEAIVEKIVNICRSAEVK